MLGPKDTRQTVFKFFDSNPTIAIQYLHKAGCSCNNPSVGFHINTGPKCKTCGTIASCYEEVRKEFNLK